jgi:hypothetical protein
MRVCVLMLMGGGHAQAPGPGWLCICMFNVRWGYCCDARCKWQWQAAGGKQRAGCKSQSNNKRKDAAALHYKENMMKNEDNREVPSGEWCITSGARGQWPALVWELQERTSTAV